MRHAPSDLFEITLGFAVVTVDLGDDASAKRNPSTRSVGEGGDQERELAAKYRRWAQLRRVDYPFTSSVINRIAEWYDRDAEGEDARVALEKRLNK